MIQKQNKFDQRCANESRTQCVSISSMTEDVLKHYAKQIETRNIHVDKDLSDFSASVYPQFIHSAVRQLIENAIDSMPSGGELNVTLIDGESCWELEVADSKSPRSEADSGDSCPETIHALDQLAGAVSSKLEMARRAAIIHGGRMQTWNCPQGGTANVLVIPRRQETGKAA